MTLRVLLVDDHPLYRTGVRMVLEAAGGIEVVAEAETVGAVVPLLVEHQPDLVLMDLALPDGSGVAATREVLAARPGTRVLVVTMSEDADNLLAAVRAGALGYLLKGAGADEVVRAVRTAGAGGAVFSPRMAERLTGLLVGVGAVPAREAFPGLTEREREVLGLLAGGLDNRGIARRMFLSDKTVRNHVSNLLAKLGVADRTAAALRAREAGFGGE